MENSPLTLAHTHARNAVLETKRANPVAASEEHDLAAAEFAAAAQLTKDNEALRILSLLEQHHKRLGQILKSQHTRSAQDHPPVTSTELNTSKAAPAPSADTVRSSSPETTSQPPRLVRTGRPSARDLSSSIASNLASARGIPNNRQKRPGPISPLISNQHADGQISHEDDRRGNDVSHKSVPTQTARGVTTISHRPSWAPPADINEAVTSEKAKVDPTASDAPFQQFYSTFESLISKISAPLAFAGLPLGSQPTPAAPNVSSPAKLQASRQLPPPTPPPSNKPLDASLNYSQLISRAALRAVSHNDKSSPYGNPAESFYVVPTTGGTTSYAEIMTRADREASHHRRNTSALLADVAEDVEDTASTIMPPPPTIPSRPGLSNERKHEGKTMEEIELENKALKHLSDTLSKRLHVFEMSAQTSSAALAQSIRSLHLSPLHTPENSRGKSNTTIAFNLDLSHGNSSSSNTNSNPQETAKLKARITELEEILRKSDAKARKREDENVKLRDTLGKYRDKWDSLKAGAKARRERAAGDAGPATPGKGKAKSEGDTGNGTGIERDE